MKKYLALAAVVGVIAFASVSYLAHAEPQAAATTTTAAPAVASPAGAMEMADKLKADCTVAAAAKKADGTEPTAEEKEVSMKKCMDAPAQAATEAPKTEEPKMEGSK